MNLRQLPTQVLPLNKLVPNTGQIADVPKNPRLIRDERFKQLCKSLQEDDLTGVEPCKVVPYGDKFVVLGGNMRYRALKEIGAKDVSCIVVPEGTPAKVLRKIVQIDNAQFGGYDWDLIANEWDEVELADWGLELPIGRELDEKGEYEDPEMTEYEKAQILSVEDEYIIVKCKPEEADEMRKHFGLGYIRPLEAGEVHQDKREKARVINWSDYVNSNTK